MPKDGRGGKGKGKKGGSGHTGDTVSPRGTSTLTRKWQDSAVSQTVDLKTKDFDFGSPGVRKKIYKSYITYKSASDTNVRVRYDVDGGTDFDLDFQTGTNYAEDNLQGTGGAWAVAELKPDTSSEANNIKSFQLRFYSTGTVPSSFEINDIAIVFRRKSIK